MAMASRPVIGQEVTSDAKGAREKQRRGPRRPMELTQ
jgi:hypothetical protein